MFGYVAGIAAVGVAYVASENIDKLQSQIYELQHKERLLQQQLVVAQGRLSDFCTRVENLSETPQALAQRARQLRETNKDDVYGFTDGWFSP